MATWRCAAAVRRSVDPLSLRHFHSQHDILKIIQILALLMEIFLHYYLLREANFCAKCN